MTIPTSDARTGPYAGNGITTAFAYDFRILDESHIQVILTDANAVETIQTITTHYTVSGVDVAGGGTVTMVTPPASGETLTLVRNVPLTQTADYKTRGSVSPTGLERALDKLTQLVQDVSETLTRAWKVPASTDMGSVSTVMPAPAANELVGWNSGATALENKGTVANINTVAAIVADITAVANISADVTSVAAIDTNVTTVAGDSADIVTVAGISGDVTTVAGDSADIVTLAGISGDVTTVAGIAADVTSVATALAGGDIAVADGGTGASTATDARTNLGLGSMATQWRTNVDIDGGEIDDTPIGANVPSTGAFTTLTASSLTLTTDLAVAEGGTGASTAAAARINLGLVIGTDVLAPNGDGSSLTNLPGKLTLLATASPSSVASVLFTGISSDYPTLLLVGRGMKPATDNVQLRVQASASGTPVTTGYQDGGIFANYNTASPAGAGTTAAFWLTRETGNASNEAASGILWIHDLQTAAYTFVNGQAAMIDNGGAVDYLLHAGSLLNTTAYTELSIAYDSGNISDGELRLYGVGDS